jgi:hypothetical protein
MANITINTTPPVLALAGNGLEFNVSTSNAKSSTGTNAKFSVAFSANWEEIDATNELIFICDLFTVTFVFDDTPDESGNQLPTPAAYASVILWSDAVRDAIFKNTLISSNCYLSQIPDNVFFDIVFWEKGDFNLDVDETISGVGDGISATPVQGVDDAYYDNYRLCALLLRNSLPPVIIEKFPFPDLDVDFDIKDYIKNIPNPDFTFDAEDIIFSHSDFLVKYICKFFEQYGSPPVPSILYPDSFRYALPGGVDTETLMYLDGLETDILAYFISNNKFLTHAEDNIQLKSGDIYRLFFLCQAGQDVKFKYARYNADGYIIGSWQTALTHFLLTDYSIIEIVCDPDELVSDFDTTKSVKVKLYDAETSADISETRTFIINNDLSSQRLQFVFANSFEAAFDTIFAYGKAEHSFDLENYTLIHIEDTSSQSRSKRQDKFIIRSGHLTFQQLFYWQEFIQSNKRYLVRDGRRLPVRVISTNVFMYKNQIYNFGIEIEIEVGDLDPYRSSIPNSGIAFSDYFNSYGYAFSLNSSGVGHTILDPDANEMMQRANLQLTGYNVGVSDDSDNDRTIINIGHTGLWFEIDALGVALPPTTSTIEYIVDLTDSIKPGNIIQIDQYNEETEETTTHEAIVDEVTWDSMEMSCVVKITTEVLSLTDTITSVKVKSLSGPIVSSKNFTLDKDEWSELNTQTLSVPGIGYIFLVFVSPAGSDFTNYENFASAQIIGSSQGSSQIVVKCKNLPTANISIKITYIWQ